LRRGGPCSLGGLVFDNLLLDLGVMRAYLIEYPITAPTMFDNLDETLKHLLDADAAPAALRDAEVSFATPERGFAPQQATINLFLHEVRENAALRDPAPIVELKDGVYQSRRPPLRVDCAYMVSAWSNEAAAAKVVEEHRLLGLAFAWLSRFPTIPAEHLQGALVGQPFPPPALVAQLDGDRRNGEFWSALGTPPRPSFSLVVTIALDLDAAVAAGRPVTGLAGSFGAGERGPQQPPRIGGRVLSAAGGPIPGALIEAPNHDLQAQTDAGGRFLLPWPGAASFSVRASALGFRSVERTLVPPETPAQYRPEEYEFVLQPLPNA
jgi:hypothetical protein